MSKTDIGSSSAAQYTRSFENLRGIDLSTDASQIHRLRCPHLVNMYRDYDAEHGAAIETIPGYRRLFHFDGKIHGIWGYASTQDDDQIKHIVVHAGTKLYTFKVDERDSGKYELRYDKLADSKSTAFLQNNNFYICDGTGIYVMAADFSVKPIEEVAYAPITYLHGAPYEQRNMITDHFVNRDTAISEESDIFGYERTENYWKIYLDMFEYEIEERSLGSTTYKNYTVAGYKSSHPNYGRRMEEVDVLSLSEGSGYVQMGKDGDYYTMHYIRYAPKFAKDIRRVIVRGSGISEEYRTYLENQFPNATEIICSGVFYDVSGSDADKPYEFKMYLYDPCTEILSVKANEETVIDWKQALKSEKKPALFYMPVYEIVTEDGEEKHYVSFVRFLAKYSSNLDAKIIDVEGLADTVNFETAEKLRLIHTDYMTANNEYSGTSKEAILGCGLSATFDGRVFLTGNKNLPNTVFYSCRDLTGYNNPTYYGVYNYFNDGEGNEPNVALLSTTSVLMVLKRNTIQGSAIYYHTAADGIDDVVPRIYPSTPGVVGLGCEGPAMNFLDDAIFLSERGLEGLSKQQLNLERTIGHRSSCVDRRLTRNDLSKASMCRYKGYLCIFDGKGGVYLADSNQLYQGIDGSAEYEWFYLEGIGDYEGDSCLYKTMTQFAEFYPKDGAEAFTLEGVTLYDKPLRVTEVAEDVAESEIYTGEVDIEVDGVAQKVRFKYTEREDGLYLCETNGERVGGDFSPSCIGFSLGEIFLFGTEGGSICCFNMDKRNEDPFNDGWVAVGTIHPSYYSFVGHRYRSELSLISDNCGAPHLTKRTSRKTCVAKLKNMRGSSVNVRISTDRMPSHTVLTSFANQNFNCFDPDFSHWSFSDYGDTIVTIKDKEKKWVEKQISLYSDGYCRPFGLYSLTYNYEIQGRVKKG